MTELAIPVAAAATLVWLGMVLAISFLEAPLKFRTEGLELRVGLAIGRIVFRALNIAEVLWAVVIAVCLSVTGASGPVLMLAAVTAVLLAVQPLLARPRLNRRSADMLAGQDTPPPSTSRAAMTTSASYAGDLTGDVEDSGSAADHARSASVARWTQEANFSDSARSAT